MTTTDARVDELLSGYVECALWSSTDQSTESGGYPLDDNYGREDIAPESLASMREDCAAFLQSHGDDLDTLVIHERYSYAHAGHDFWLTRNHHGAGFWDRGFDALGERLTEAAHAYGSSDLYVGDDGKVWAA
jgi:hypothetical protein